MIAADKLRHAVSNSQVFVVASQLYMHLQQALLVCAETPAWRRGKLEPYIGENLCNACQIWERRHKVSLTYSGKVTLHLRSVMCHKIRAGLVQLVHCLHFGVPK